MTATTESVQPPAPDDSSAPSDADATTAAAVPRVLPARGLGRAGLRQPVVHAVAPAAVGAFPGRRWRASPRPSGTGWAWRRPGSGASSPTGRPGPRDAGPGGCSRSRLPSSSWSPLVLGQRWQHQLRDLMGIARESWIGPLLIPVAGVLVFLLLVAVGRLLGHAARGSRRCSRAASGRGRRVSSAGSLVLAVFALLLSDGLYDRGLSAADRTFEVQNAITPEGVEQPDSALRSGSPASLVSWDSLGREGRKFTASGPDGRGARRPATGPRPPSRSGSSRERTRRTTRRRAPRSPSATSNAPAGSTAGT